MRLAAHNRPQRHTPILFSRALALIALMIAASIFPARAFAQGETTSAIVGQVTDTTGAVVPGASITITNRETGLTRSAQSDDAGRFNFPN